jgi:hypothetical protein
MPDEEKPGEDASPDINRVEIKSTEEALVFLFDGLREAYRLFVEEKDAGRRGVIEALNVVTEFLRSSPGTTGHRQPFTHLLNALLSLDKGDVRPLLKPARRSGRSPASAARESDKAPAAGTVHQLCQTGLDPDEAYALVAKACRDSGMKPERSGAKDRQEPEITGRTVRGWCEKIAEDFGHHLQAAQTFDRMRQSEPRLAQAIKSDGIEAVRNALLEGLRRSLVEMRASEH